LTDFTPLGWICANLKPILVQAERQRVTMADLVFHYLFGDCMSISMSSASVPLFVKMLGNLSYFLDKAQAHADAKKFDSANFMGTRLAVDMLPFWRQITIACDACKIGVARIAGVEAPKYEDNETTLAQLKERIAKTVEFLKSVDTAKLDGTETKDITFPVGKDATRTMHLKHWVIPNFFFHVTTAYALLRHNGVDLGKGEYLVGAPV
jgi:uncharacterized protein